MTNESVDYARLLYNPIVDFGIGIFWGVVLEIVIPSSDSSLESVIENGLVAFVAGGVVIPSIGHYVLKYDWKTSYKQGASVGAGYFLGSTVTSYLRHNPII